MQASLHASLPVSFKRFLTYFCCDMNIPDFEWATSIPKYFNFLNSSISNPLSRHCLKISFSPLSFPNNHIITYARRVVNLSYFSPLSFLNPYFEHLIYKP